MSDRLAEYGTNIFMLCLLLESDISGRTPRPQGPNNVINHLYQRALDLGCCYNRQKPILNGEDLISLGFNPTKVFGSVLKSAYKLQLQGSFFDKQGALRVLKSIPEYKDL